MAEEEVPPTRRTEIQRLDALRCHPRGEEELPIRQGKVHPRGRADGVDSFRTERGIRREAAREILSHLETAPADAWADRRDEINRAGAVPFPQRLHRTYDDLRDRSPPPGVYRGNGTGPRITEEDRYAVGGPDTGGAPRPGHDGIGVGRRALHLRGLDDAIAMHLIHGDERRRCDGGCRKEPPEVLLHRLRRVPNGATDVERVERRGRDATRSNAEGVTSSEPE